MIGSDLQRIMQYSYMQPYLLALLSGAVWEVWMFAVLCNAACRLIDLNLSFGGKNVFSSYVCQYL